MQQEKDDIIPQSHQPICERVLISLLKKASILPPISSTAALMASNGALIGDEGQSLASGPVASEDHLCQQNKKADTSLF